MMNNSMVITIVNKSISTLAPGLQAAFEPKVTGVKAETGYKKKSPYRMPESRAFIFIGCQFNRYKEGVLWW